MGRECNPSARKAPRERITELVHIRNARTIIAHAGQGVLGLGNS